MQQTGEEDTATSEDHEICCCDCTSSESSSSSSSSEAGDPPLYPSLTHEPPTITHNPPFKLPSLFKETLLLSSDPSSSLSCNLVEKHSSQSSDSPYIFNDPPSHFKHSSPCHESLDHTSLPPKFSEPSFLPTEPSTNTEEPTSTPFYPPLPPNNSLEPSFPPPEPSSTQEPSPSPPNLPSTNSNLPSSPLTSLETSSPPAKTSSTASNLSSSLLNSSEPCSPLQEPFSLPTDLNPLPPSSLLPVEPPSVPLEQFSLPLEQFSHPLEQFSHPLEPPPSPTEPFPPLTLDDPSIRVLTTTPDSPCSMGGKVPYSPPPSPAVLGKTTPPLSPGARGGGPGPRFKLLTEGEVQCCYLNHTRTVVSKILSSKFLRRWENHRLYLNDSCISSKTPSACVGTLDYTRLEDVYVIGRWDAGHKFCVRLVIPDGSLLLQANNAYTRDQWYHSIIWKKNIFKYRNILKRSARSDVIVKEIKNLVDFVKSTPIQDECVSHVPIEIVSAVLEENSDCWSDRQSSEELISAVMPLLDNTPPSTAICRFLSAHCLLHPRSPLVEDAITPVIHRILKHNVDFSKFPHTRRLVQDYIYALHSHNDGADVIRRFIASVHGPISGCPHPRVLPNLISVSLAAVFAQFEVPSMLERRNLLSSADEQQIQSSADSSISSIVNCYLDVFQNVSDYDDWLPGLAQLLQPLPFPDEALGCEAFARRLAVVVRRVAIDGRCEVHQCVRGVRAHKDGWFDVFCPESMVCFDDGRIWGDMLDTLLNCCCRRKSFVAEVIGKRLGACLLLALRGNDAAQTLLCLALEWGLVGGQEGEVVEGDDDRRATVVTTLQSTPTGQLHYTMLCDRINHLKELQQKGGPRKLTLPSRSTDTDVIRLLSVGAFGNLECLSLAFTHVTSACAEYLIKLPALRYLNLWATKFGDAGLMMISEHLPKLQVLNLCETPISDRGILALSTMSNLKKLNLNSTQLSAEAFEMLKQKLPGLQEMDVRYTEAW